MSGPIDRRTAVAALAGAFATPLLGGAVLGQDMPLRLATAPLDVSAQPYYALKRRSPRAPRWQRQSQVERSTSR
jgi:CBS-domain-containing membrane protein